MSRKFIIVDPEEEIQLLLSQYLSMGWHDADIEEESLTSVLDDKSLVADAIIIGGINPEDGQVQKIMERSNNGELPPTIVVSDEENTANGNTILLEDLTPVMLNGAIAEAIKQHADGTSSTAAASISSSTDDERADNELPIERLEGLKGYRLIRELGRGGMSRVYLAEDNDTGKEVAIKVLDTDTIEDDRMIERFIREYSMLASIDNQHVASILDQTFTDEYAFIIMERFQGGDLNLSLIHI